MFDSVTNLQWEQKDTTVGRGADAGNLHDVDSHYIWAGRCTLQLGTFCQPNAPAAAACAAQTGGAVGCAECGVGEGTCDTSGNLGFSITAVWDWVSQLNAMNFAGFNDWRLATSAGTSSAPTGRRGWGAHVWGLDGASSAVVGSDRCTAWGP